ncbi:hypothetical protein [Haladaptatus sp. DYF46]|uniref:hypothetical protein n=1 Tax=Haladaptatus sp. DYF46 TaxID=2886041 RepID=UPI001E38921D|nr:hypothetical protein [Haladaptatus sp. DYF46]
MSSRTLLLQSRLQTTRQEQRDFLGWLLIGILTTGLTLLLGLPLTRTLPVVGVFALGKLLDLLIAIFALPNVFESLVPGLALLGLSVWLFFRNGPSLIMIGTAFASGWILHSAIRSSGNP